MKSPIIKTSKSHGTLFKGDIENKYLVPLIKDYTKRNKRIEIDGFDAYCLVLNQDASVLRNEKVYEYIKWGEK